MVAPAEYPPLATCESEEDGGTRLALTGELDLATAPTLRDSLRQSGTDTRDVRLDPSKLEFVDCAGMNVQIPAVNDARTFGVRLDLEGDLVASGRTHASRWLQESQTDTTVLKPSGNRAPFP